MKAPGLTREVHLKLVDLSLEEESGIHGVAVECVDIMRNTEGVGNPLGLF